MTPSKASSSTPSAMTDGTLAKGRRAMDTASGFLRRDSSFLRRDQARRGSPSGFVRRDQRDQSTRRDPSTNDEIANGAKSPGLAESLRLVRSYAARVKQKPPFTEPSTFEAAPPFPSTFRQLLQKPRPLEESDWRLRRLPRKERSPPQAPPFPAGSVIRRPCYFPPELGLFETAVARINATGSPLARTSSEEGRPAPRLSSPPPPISRASSTSHGTVAHFSRRAAPDLFSLDLPLTPMSRDGLRPAPSESKRFLVVGAARHAAQLTEVFC